jgi:hypothetical protein
MFIGGGLDYYPSDAADRQKSRLPLMPMLCVKKDSDVMKLHPLTIGFVLLLLIIPIVTFSQSTGPSYPKADDKAKTSAKDNKAPNSPPVIGTVPTTNPSKDSSTGNQGNANMKAADERIADLTFWLVVLACIQAAIFIGQCIAMGIQAKRLRETVQASKSASEDTQVAIAQFRRSADAMQTVAHNQGRFSKAELRA